MKSRPKERKLSGMSSASSKSPKLSEEASSAELLLFSIGNYQENLGTFCGKSSESTVVLRELFALAGDPGDCSIFLVKP